MTKEEISNIYNKLSDLGRGDLADQFYSDPAKFDFTQLELDPNFTDQYETIADFLEDHAAIKANLWKKYEGKFPSDTRFESLQSKYPWLNKEDLKTYFDKSNEYKKFYEDEAKKEGEKNLRKKEVKDWGFFRNLLASDYEKQRYIEDPNAALFGEQAPALGKAPETRWGATGDLATGGAGAIADALPGVGKSLIGPGIRLGRDLTHKAVDSPYQKDWTQIGTDTFADVATNLGAAILFNARKGARLASGAADKDVKNALEAARETEHIKSSLPQVAEHMHLPSQAEIDFYRSANLPYPSSDRALRNAVKDIPESDLKSELSSIVYTEPGKPINRAEVQRIYQKYLTQTQPGMREAVRLADDYMRPIGKIGEEPVTQYLRNAADAKTFSELNKYQKAQYLANQAAMAINSGKPGQIAVQEGANYLGRGSNPKVVETALKKAEYDKTIDRLISSYSLLWNKNKEPVEAKNNPLIKAAWEKWSKQ